MVSDRFSSNSVKPAPSAPGIARTANCATRVSDSSNDKRPVDSCPNWVKLTCRSSIYSTGMPRDFRDLNPDAEALAVTSSLITDEALEAFAALEDEMRSDAD